MIVNADDLGESLARNDAIFAALQRGLVTGTSVMANGGAFEEACAAAHDLGHSRRVGVHLVLTDGEALTEPIRRCPRFCDHEGRFHAWRGSARAFLLSPGERAAVAGELRAQIERCREGGLPLSHLDSHHHVHNERGVAAVVLPLARELDIPRVRIARNCGPGIGPLHRVYKEWLNRRIRRAGLAGTRWFGDASDLAWLRERGVPDADDFELMTHPAFRDGELVLDA